jgi:hypothetical protein
MRSPSVGGLAQNIELLVALDGADLFEHVVEADDVGVREQRGELLVDIERQPAVRIERTGETVHSRSCRAPASAP